MMIRLFVPDDLAPGRAVELSAQQAHYLRDVMRRRAGEAIVLFNGRDGEWRAPIVEMGRKGARATPKARLREQATGPDLELVVALVKRTRLETIIEKATELGVARVRLAITRFTQAERTNLARLAAIAVEASEQTGRLDTPKLVAPAKLEAILRDWPADRALIFCDEGGDAAPLLSSLLPLAGEGGPQRGSDEGSLRIPGSAGGRHVIDGGATPHPTASRPPSPARGEGTPNSDPPVSILIGPEGGFSSEERAHFRSLPFVIPVSLGPRILRADTAAIAALSLWQATRGDWRP